MTPIDEDPMPPPSSGVDIDYLTQDIESMLHRAALDLVEDTAVAHGIGRRRAAMIVIRRLRQLRGTHE